MKIIGLVGAVFLLIFISISQTWAFGPHSTVITSEQPELPKGIPIYQNYTEPIFYLSQTRRDVIDLSEGQEVIEVEGTSSKTRVFIPLGYLGYLLGVLMPGVSFDVMNRSIEKAIDDAKSRYGVQTLYDVRIDKHVFSIFDIYTVTTTIVHAKGIR